MTRTTPTDAGSIPVIDITPLREDSNARTVAEALLAASQNLGFIYISGHGIPENVITTARTRAFDFFKHPQSEKQRYRVTEKHRGWLAPGGARMQHDVAVDLKESYIWGYQDEDGNSPSDHELRGPNQWPEFVPGMESAAVDYFHHADRVARQLLGAFAVGLNLRPDFFSFY